MTTKKEYDKNKELFKSIARKWYHDNKERSKLRHAKWYQENKETQRQKQREYSKEYLKRPEVKERVKKYAKEHYNPQRQLQANIRHIKKYSVKLKLPDKKFKYALVAWSKLVREKDQKKCQICGSTKRIYAHHIFEKSKYPQLSLNPNNGITLCYIHHQQTHGRKLLD